MSSYFITGASRGIGFEIVKQLSALPSNQISIIFAAIRSDVPSQLQEVINKCSGRVVPIQVQVTDRSSIDKATKVVDEKLAGNGLDALINNAYVSNISAAPSGPCLPWYCVLIDSQRHHAVHSRWYSNNERD